MPGPDLQTSLKEHEGRALFIAIPFFHMPSSVLAEPREDCGHQKSGQELLGMVRARSLLCGSGVQTWLLLVLSLFPSLELARIFDGCASFTGSRSKVTLHSMQKDFVWPHLSWQYIMLGPLGVHLDALGLLVKAWVWGWCSSTVKSKATAQEEG